MTMVLNMEVSIDSPDMLNVQHWIHSTISRDAATSSIRKSSTSESRSKGVWEVRDGEQTYIFRLA
jgi:hypothetical protein